MDVKAVWNTLATVHFFLNYFVSIVLGNRIIFFSAKKTNNSAASKNRKTVTLNTCHGLQDINIAFVKLIWCTASVIFFPFDYTAEKFMQSVVIWQYCITSLYRILSVLGAKVSHINDLYSLPVLQKHTKVTEECTTFFFFFGMVFLLITHLAVCWAISWNMRMLQSRANTEDCDWLEDLLVGRYL